MSGKNEWIAQVQIQDAAGRFYEVGQPVPASVLKAAPWLKSDGHVICVNKEDDMSQHPSVVEKPASQQAEIAVSSGVVGMVEPSDSIVASAASQEG